MKYHRERPGCRVHPIPSYFWPVPNLSFFRYSIAILACIISELPLNNIIYTRPDYVPI